jgi:hypothetical protein
MEVGREVQAPVIAASAQQWGEEGVVRTQHHGGIDPGQGILRAAVAVLLDDPPLADVLAVSRGGEGLMCGRNCLSIARAEQKDGH